MLALLAEIRDWILAKFWKNFGKVTDNIYRSGQMGKFRLRTTAKYLNLDCIIGLNMDNSSKKEKYEIEYCTENGIEAIHYNWGAGKNVFPEELEIVLKKLEHNYIHKIPTLIHCAGGRDRTGGTLGKWMLRSKTFKAPYDRGILEHWLEMCSLYKVPAEGWSEEVFKEYTNQWLIGEII